MISYQILQDFYGFVPHYFVLSAHPLAIKHFLEQLKLSKIIRVPFKALSSFGKFKRYCFLDI